MRKRGKKRIPQDIKPWVRVKNVDHDVLALPGRKTSRWTAGSHRDWNTRVLNTTNKQEVAKVMLKSLLSSLGNAKVNFAQLLMQKLTTRKHTNKIISLARYKNFCVFSGRARTYDRSLHMARHTVRKLVGTGLISGLLK